MKTVVKTQKPPTGTREWGILPASTLKLLACVFMLIDHVGAEIYTDIILFRIIGRLAYPLFAFFIAEGCKYTRNKLRHFMAIFLMGVFCELVYVIFSGEYYGNILLTFSLSILLIYAMDKIKNSAVTKRWIWIACFVALTAAVYTVTATIGVDYGFWGVAAPLFAAIPDSGKKQTPTPERLLKVASFSVGLIILALSFGANSIQLWSLWAIPLILMYNGKVGDRRFKYGFYVFYPLHLAIIGLIASIK